MKKMKRILAIMLCLTMAISGPLSVFAEETETAIEENITEEEKSSVCETCQQEPCICEAEEEETEESSEEAVEVCETCQQEPCVCIPVEETEISEELVEVCETCQQEACICSSAGEEQEEDIIDDAEEFESIDHSYSCIEDYMEGEFQSPIPYTSVADLMPPIEGMIMSPLSLRTLRMADTPVKNDNIYTSKTVIYDENEKSYSLRLESYLTGEPTITTAERIPSDIIMVLDQSGSMDYCFICGDDDMDSKYHAWSGIKFTTQYYCKDASGKNDVELHFCDGQTEECAYVKYMRTKKNPDTNYTHSRGWYDVDHTEIAKFGIRYVPSIGDSIKHVGDSYSYMRIFYTDENCQNKAVININENGVYYRKETGNYIRLYYCDECCAWFDTDEHNNHRSGENVKNENFANPRIPDGESGDDSLRAFEFWHDVKNHKISAQDVKTEIGYYVKTKDYATGDVYERVKYCKECTAWHIENSGDHAVKYCPNENVFYLNCKDVTVNRKEALQNALNLFLEDIYADSAGKDEQLGTADDVDNRIAMVGFGSYDTPTGNYDATNAVLTYSEDGSSSKIIGYGIATQNHYKGALQSVSNENGQSVVNDAVAKLLMVSNTETYKGMRMAQNVFEQNPVGNEKRNRIVVVFTDGIPYSPDTDSSGRTGNYAFANDALTTAKELKADGVTVYTIGVFDGADASKLSDHCNSATYTANKFMHLLSSNFLDATKMEDKYAESDNSNLKDGNSFYLSANTTEALNNIFKAIAQNITGGGAHITTMDQTTQVKDVVSAHFVIPEGQTVSVHTEKFTGNTTWVNDQNTEIDQLLKLERDGNAITVTGFNFAQHYVATDIDHGEEKPRGRKLVIEIPIAVAETNNGGVNQPTNNSSSGIYLNDKCLENFDMPYVDIPTNVQITKTVVGKNVSSDKKFDFEISYTKFNNVYKGNDQSSGNYLETKENLEYNHEDVKKEVELANNGNESLVDVLVDSEITIKELATSDYLVEYSLDGGKEWNILNADANGDCTLTLSVTAGMNIQIRNTIQIVDLIIEKDGIQDADNHNADTFGKEEKQSSIFKVTGPNNLELEVAIVGNESVTIKNLPVGEYKVEELIDWTWRYGIEDETQFITLTPTGDNKVVFNNERNNVYWLSGDNYKKNLFKSSLQSTD